MEKKVLFVAKGKSFMANTIARNLQDSEYNVIRIEPELSELTDHKDEADLIIFLLGSFVEDGSASSFLVYVKDICMEEDKTLILAGTATEIAAAKNSIPATVISATFQRPFDMAKLVEQADWLVRASDDLAQRKSILLVDDDGTFLKMMKSWLSSKYRVTLVTSGAQALMYIADNSPDLILLDYEMPVTSGPQLLEMIRSEPKLDSTPVIFLTGKGDRESVLKVLSLKPDGYLLKSMPRENILAAVEDFFEKKKYKDLHSSMNQG